MWVPKRSVTVLVTGSPPVDIFFSVFCAFGFSTVKLMVYVESSSIVIVTLPLFLQMIFGTRVFLLTLTFTPPLAFAEFLSFSFALVVYILPLMAVILRPDGSTEDS